MRIVPYPDFRHAGSLRGISASKDPREANFTEKQVDIDLRACEFVRAPAALWCVIYALLSKSRGSDCRLLVPGNIGVCIYLKSLGLFQILQDSGVDADDRDVHERSDSQIVLPLTRFETLTQAEELTVQAVEALMESGLGAANLYSLVSETFGELAVNAVEHSDSSVGAFGLIQFYDSAFGPRFVCGVADGGIGIRRSLERNPELADRVPYDWVAIELAARERISSKPDKTRGIGLFGVAEDMRSIGRSLIIHSGIGSMQISEDSQGGGRRTNMFPGTLAYASIPT